MTGDALAFEDFTPGATWEFGEVEVTEQAICEFGLRFDPQPFHTDPEAAGTGPFGGLVASGWHTVALTTRILVEELYARSRALGSPGVESIRWPSPVRPGDRLSVRFSVLDARRSQSRPDRGVVRCRVETLTQNGDVAMTLEGVNFFGCREPGA